MKKTKSQKHFAVILGTRPEAIKLLPLVAEVEKNARVTLVSTGQHRDLLADVFAAFGRQPDVSLSLMREEQPIGDLLAAILTSLPPLLTDLSPDAVIVQGDTATAFAGALAAFLCHIPVCHVEAGMRTFDLSAPFPEEAFRRFITQIADLHFAPTEFEYRNLLREHVAERKIFVTGNTVLDALRRFRPTVSADVADTVLMTCHRRENRAEFDTVAALFDSLAEKRPDLRFLFLCHPSHKPPPLRFAEILPPQPIADFYRLLSAARLVLTDSGGVEEEAAILGIPTLVLRDRTERVAELAAGAIRTVGTNPLHIRTAVEESLASPHEKRAMPQHSPSSQIAKILASD